MGKGKAASKPAAGKSVKAAAPKKAAAKKAAAKPAASIAKSMAGASISKVASAIGIRDGSVSVSRGGGYKRRHRKSAIWYQREILRLKLKRRYEKVKYGMVR
jgi:hypothetical protein